MAKKGKLVEAVAYIRTSSAANVGTDKDSDKRQRAAIESFAKRSGFALVAEYNDAAVSVPIRSIRDLASPSCSTGSRGTVSARSLSRMPRALLAS